jgi:diguanylate cyclase (GGDEF)-like protein/putative nucleotidyltransferase with HDIG domain
MEAITDPVAVIGAEHLIGYVNEAAAEVLGRCRHDLVGRDIRPELPADLRGPFEDATRAAFHEGRPHYLSEHFPAGRRWFDVRLFPFDGQMLVVLHDVTDLKTTQHRSVELADEHDRLRRVAIAVAAEQPPEDVFRLIAQEVRGLVGADVSAVSRFEDKTFRVVGADGDEEWLSAFRNGPTAFLPGSAIGHMRDIQGPLAVADLQRTHYTGRFVGSGARGTVIVPIMVGDRAWGGMSVASYDVWPHTDRIVERVQRFAELASLAVVSTEVRAELHHRATTDPATGLPNSAVFRERLTAEVARSGRHGRPFCLAVFDVDRFKSINDGHGHATGDALLAQIACCLADPSDAGDLTTRIGGDEFAMLIVGRQAAQALAVVERARQRVASLPGIDGARARVSAGLCEWRPGLDADALFRRADDALYWAKANGRDAAWIYDPAVVVHLEPDVRRDHVQRGQAVAALRALARAIDAKDASTLRHAERVAGIARGIARELGWSDDRAELLHEAGLLHDVGKIGVPDAILLKPGRLDPAEREQIKRHAALGAEITEGVLSSEQVLWVRGHHERPDGTGYPDGLVDEQIPEGAAILALADTWDVMISERPYSPRKSPPAALRECRELADRQFRAAVVDALERAVTRTRIAA